MRACIRKSVLLIAFIFSTGTAPAAVLDGTGATRTYQGSELKLVGQGIRSKKFLVKFKVYEISYFAANETKGLELKLLRELDAEKIRHAFEEALKANNVDVKAPMIQDFFQFVKASGEVKEGQTFRIVSKNPNHVIIENPQGGTKEFEGSNIGGQILSIWFGTPVDDDMADLKKALLK